VLSALISVVGLTWGLPTRDVDRFLFPDGDVWAGERIYALAGAAEKLSPARTAITGADVDIDPIDQGEDRTASLNDTDEDIAKILLRYRLYTYQPDEMITMMALSGMRPGRLDFDPRLYQYGGLFIYPVGALIKLCGVIGLIDVRSNVVFYLDNPDEFGKFYIVARLYSAAWGLLGVFIVFAITNHTMEFRARRGSGAVPVVHPASDIPTPAPVLRTPIPRTPCGGAGVLAGFLFISMPVVVCMSHEAKPHLPGAVLMLAAVLFAVRHVTGRSHSAALPEPAETQGDSSRDWWMMCACCGAAAGMVLSAWPIVVLIPLATLWTPQGAKADSAAGGNGRGLGRARWATALTRSSLGLSAVIVVYLVANPYVAINALTNRAVLRSNFGNSLGMYEVTRIGEGLVRVVELTREGATLPIVLLGAVAFLAASLRRNKAAMLLAIPALIFFVQFVLIGAGKPAEYGRFGVFTNTALAIGTACTIASQWRRGRSIGVALAAVVVCGWVSFGGAAYLRNFWLDAAGRGSRVELANRLADWLPAANVEGQAQWTVVLPADPAPYNCPPLDFRRVPVVTAEFSDRTLPAPGGASVRIAPVDHLPKDERVKDRWWGVWRRETPISWANKPFDVRLPDWTAPESRQGARSVLAAAPADR